MLKKSEEKSVVLAQRKKCHSCTNAQMNRKKCRSCTNVQMNIKIDKMRKKCLNIKNVKYFLNILLYS